MHTLLLALVMSVTTFAAPAPAPLPKKKPLESADPIQTLVTLDRDLTKARAKDSAQNEFREELPLSGNGRPEELEKLPLAPSQE